MYIVDILLKSGGKNPGVHGVLPSFQQLSDDGQNIVPKAERNEFQSEICNTYPLHKLRGYKVVVIPRSIVVRRDYTGGQTRIRQTTTVHSHRWMDF